MRKALLYTTTMLAGLALATGAYAADEKNAADGAKPAASENMQTQDRSAQPAQQPASQMDADRGADSDMQFRSFTRTENFEGEIAGGYTADELIGTDIVDSNGETVGEVADLLIDKDNKISKVLVDVGGFLGIGEKRVALNLDELSREGDEIRVSMTEEQLQSEVSYEEADGVYLPSETDRPTEAK